MSGDPLDSRRAHILRSAERISDLSQRADYIRHACGANEKLRVEIEDLLKLGSAASSLDVGDPHQPAPTSDIQASDPLPVSSDRTATSAASIGTKVRYFGDYELLEEIARGGMGIVYKARQSSLNRTVALKMIRAGQKAGEIEVQRFQSEATAAANLQHPGIVAIYEVGNHAGQHYYSMEYVEGESLAEKLRGGPLDTMTTVAYVKAAAEAIQYAHSQGILHRDMKPSNILIDRSGRVRIADFGLAKRFVGDSSLTVTGQVLGTPSYMPPEQALGSVQPNAAFDVYSLGAVLYELLTGRPPFRAESPLATLKQVIDHEPAAPRLLNPNISSDAETICLKCLCKDPKDRYESAQSLAEDLGRLLNGELIWARRIGRPERVRRWLWKRRRMIVTLLGVALLPVAFAGAWRQYWRLQQGFVVFETDGRPLTTEVLDEFDALVHPPFTSPTPQPIRLQEGTYRVRFSAPRQLSEDYQLSVARGGTYKSPIVLEDRQLWPPLDLHGVPHIIRLENEDDVLVANKSGVQRRSGRTGEVLWNADGGIWDTAFGSSGVPNWKTQLQRYWGYLNDHRYAHAIGPQPVRPAPDLTGDGVGDVIWVMGQFGGLVALSGETGELLWQRFPADLAAHVDQQVHVYNAVPMPDVDHDGVEDLIAIVSRQSHSENGKAAPDCRVEAISGRSGATIWCYTIDRQYYQGPSSWDVGSSSVSSSGHATPQAAVATVRGKGHIAILAGKALISVDAITGAANSVVHTFSYPIQDWLLADVDGDHCTDVLLLVYDRPNQQSIVAVSLGNVGTSWRCTLTNMLGSSHSWRVSNIGSARSDVFFCAFSSAPTTISQTGFLHQLTVRCIHGQTGSVRWEAAYDVDNTTAIGKRPFDLTMAPDIDGDGFLDLCLAMNRGRDVNVSDHHVQVSVDALSGQHGKELWSWRSTMPLGAQEEPRLTSFLSWQPWPNASPTLVASFDKATINVLEAKSGRLLQEISQIAHPDFADLNGDAIADLYWIETRRTGQSVDQSRLQTIRGESTIAWRRLGRHQRVGDIDGDGVDDLIEFDGGGVDSRWLAAINGRDGRTIWKKRVRIGRLACAGDLNGDGVPDVILFGGNGQLLDARSGQDGRSIWTVGERELPERGMGQPSMAKGADLDGDGERELILGWANLGKQAAVMVFAGQTGRLIWKQEIAAQDDHQLRELFIDGTSDLDGDGRGDPLIRVHVGGVNASLDYHALNGSQGKVMWHRSVPMGWKNDVYGEVTPLPVGDVTGDGKPEIVLVDDKLEVLNGADGTTRWAWQWDHVHSPHVIINVAVKSAESQHSTENSSSGVELGRVNRSNLLPSATIADLNGFGPKFVCVLVGRSLVALDGRGQESKRISQAHWSDSESQRMVNYDVDGDGKDELLFVCDYGDVGQPSRPFASLVVLDDDLARILWERPFSQGFGELIDILPPSGELPVQAIVRDGNRIASLNGITGQMVWHTEGPRWWHEDFTGSFNMNSRQSYHIYGPELIQRGSDRPLALFSALPYPHTSHGVACRVPTPVDSKATHDAYRVESLEIDPDVGNALINVRLANDYPQVAEYVSGARAYQLKRCWELAEAQDMTAAQSQWNELARQWSTQKAVYRERNNFYRSDHQAPTAEKDNSLAWFLAMCPDPEFRLSSEAVHFAQRAVSASPESWQYWNTLGVAQYRHGAYAEAIEALDRSSQLCEEGSSPFNTYFLAMAHWQLGKHQPAIDLYRRAVSETKISESSGEELRRIRAEAALLMSPSIHKTTK